MKSLRFGLVGFGKIARDQHLPAIEALPSAVLAAVASRNAAAPGVANYPDLETMLESESDLDAVILCQPPQTRFEAARIALLSGKHVFLEKPPGATVSEVEGLKDLAAKQRLTLFASWHSRYAAGVPRAREWISSRAPNTVQILWKEDVRVWHPAQEWIWQAGGLGVFDPGINALSILTEIIPERIRLRDAELIIPENRDTPIAARLSMASSKDAFIDAQFDFRQTGPQSWEIVVEAGAEQLVLSQGGNALAIDGVEQRLPREAEYLMMYLRFVELIQRGESDVDTSPLQLVADAFLRGRQTKSEPFHY